MKRRTLFKNFAVGAATTAAPLTSILARSAMAADNNPRLKTLFIFAKAVSLSVKTYPPLKFKST